MVARSLRFRLMVFLLVLAMPVAVLTAKEQKNEPVGKGSGSGDSIQWTTLVSGHDRIVLSVVAPDGEVYTKSFSAGKNVSFSLQDLAGKVEDGPYAYELTVMPKISAGLAKQLSSAREAGDDKKARELLRANGLSSAVTQSGTFTVSGGSIVNTELEEGTNSSIGRTPSTDAVTGGRTTPSRPGFTPAVEDQVIPDDLIVQGSACVGLDCVNNENFGFDTIRLKENNLRIHFDDTSTQAGFPANDWRLIANDSASGGSSKFSIEDSTGVKTPFTVTAGAATNSIFVDSTGRVGFRTSTPVLDIHISTGNTPAIRLEQTNASGFTAQTWDVAGNEANFFVRDVTGGSRLSFRIRPGAPTSSIDISADGDVGVGTGSPDEKLHVFENVDANTINLTENANASGLSAAGVVQARADVAITSLIAHGSARTISRFGQTLGGFSEVLNAAGDGLIVGTIGNTPLILGTNSAARMTIASTGAITVPGNFTVSGVKNFATVDPADSNNALYYTALEGPEAGTYFRGSAQTVNGEVVIELPGYFARLTESERMTVQLTPVGAPGQLYVAEKSPSRLVIKVAEGTADLQFDYLVQGVRKGYLDYQVERAGAFPVEQP